MANYVEYIQIGAGGEAFPIRDAEAQNTIADVQATLISVLDDLDGKAPAWNDDNGPDNVIAQGTTNSWTWRKWASGIAECWINDFGFDNLGVSAGGNNGTSLAFPFPFASAWSLTQNISVRHPDSNARITVKFTGKNANYCEMHVHNFGNVDVTGFAVDIHIIGRWV